MISGKTFVITAIVGLLVSCGGKELDKVKVSASTKEIPIEVGTNIAINYTDSGYLKAKVFAPLLERYSSDVRTETEMRQGITAYFYDNNGKVSSYIKSKYAIRNEVQRTLTARKDVFVVNNKGDTLRTEELIWDEKSDRIYSEQFVKITSPDRIILGSGLESNTAFTKFRVLNITGIISLKQ
jgi:LPS export ABC transporter protein LptC